MQSLRSDPFPVEAARDLLGLVRALYAAGKKRNAGEAYLRELAAIGGQLRIAIELARKHPAPDSMGHRAAWSRGERAAHELGLLIGGFESLAPVVEAARQRVTLRHEPSKPDKIARRSRRG